jgi:hypothetical protein
MVIVNCSADGSVITQVATAALAAESSRTLSNSSSTQGHRYGWQQSRVTVESKFLIFLSANRGRLLSH